MKKADQNMYGAFGSTKKQWLEKDFIKSTYFKVTLIVLIFLSLGFLIYSNTLENPFVFDDTVRILGNPDIRLDELNAKSLWDAAFGKFSARSRPIGNISFALNYYFHQYELSGYHMVNIIVHILNGILLWIFLEKTLSLISVLSEKKHGQWIALLAALLWLVNPVQTQSVTYIVQRLNSMAAMFFLLSFIFYLNGRLATKKGLMWFWFLGSALGWFMALGCKQNTATLPVFIFLYEWYFFQDLSKEWFKRSLKWVLGITVLIGIVGLIYTDFNPFEKLSRFNDFSKNEFTLAQRALTQPRVVIYYISLLFYPHPSRLNLDYDFPLSYSLIDPFTTSLSLIIILSLVLLSVYLAQRQRLISFCILWFFGNLVIESSVIPLALIFEHRLYLPSMLVSLSTVILFYRYIKFKWLPEVVICVLVILCSYWTFERNKVWQDEITLWADVIKKSPNKARPYSNLATAQIKHNMPDAAIQNSLKALQVNPNYVDAHYNIGVVLAKQDKAGEAMEHYRKALQIKPDYAKAFNNLALLLAEQGRINEAAEHYRKALQVKPDFAEAHNNLGVTLVEQGRADEAEKHYRKALQYKPDYAEPHYNLGILYTRQDKIDAAVEHYIESVQLKPDYAEAYNNLGLLLTKQGRITEAVEQYNRALQIDPDLEETQLNLGNALIEQGKTEQGINHIKKALQLKPDYVEAHNNLGGHLLGRGEIDEALTHFNAVLKINPDMPQAHNNIGIIMIHRGNINEAVFHFQKAVRINPEFELAQDNLQRALAIQRNQMDTEMEKIRAALKSNPDDPQLNYELGNLYLGEGELNQAISQFQKTLALQPNFPEALNNLAMAHTFGRQYDQALEVFQKLIALQPDNPANYYNVAVLYASLNNVTESLAWLNKAVSMGYDNWDLIKTDRDLENIRNSEGYRELVKGR